MLLKRAVDQLHSDELQEWEQDLIIVYGNGERQNGNTCK